MRMFTGFRPKVPDHYVAGGYGNLPDEPQFQGVQFDDGTVAVRWLTEFRSTSLWTDFDTFQRVHGHADYETRIEWHSGAVVTGDMSVIAADISAILAALRRIEGRAGGMSTDHKGVDNG